MADEQDINAGGQESGTDGGFSSEQSAGGQEQGGGGAASANLKGNSLMTKPEGEGPDNEADKGGQESGTDKKGGTDEQKDGQKDKGADDPAAKVPDKPEGYELKFSEETQVDTELLSSFRCAAHELGIPQGQAQKLAEMYEAHAAKAGERAVEAQQKAMDEARAKWEGEIEKSPSFVQDREHIRSALRQYGDQELYDLLNQTNLGSHPKMWSFMAKVGKALAEPGFHGKNSGKDRSAADVLYPNQGK